MKGNLMVRLMTIVILVGIGLAHISNQTNLFSANWLWLAILPAFMGLQATFTGWCPASLVGKLSKSGECCPGGSCATSKTQENDKAVCCSDSAKPSEPEGTCCGSDKDDSSGACCAGSVIEVKVLGTGCSSCNSTVKVIKAAAEEADIQVAVIKIEDVAEIASYGVMSTPAVVVDEQVIHSGSIPNQKQVLSWLQK